MYFQSTLADKLLTQTGTITSKDMRPQFLDKLQVERDRGITVKAQTCTMFFTNPKDGKTYLLNLIDTPVCKQAHKLKNCPGSC